MPPFRCTVKPPCPKGKPRVFRLNQGTIPCCRAKNPYIDYLQRMKGIPMADRASYTRRTSSPKRAASPRQRTAAKHSPRRSPKARQTAQSIYNKLSRSGGRNPTAFRKLQSRGISATEINRSLAKRMTPLSVAYADN